MSFKTIRNAQSAVWPRVRDSLDLVRKSRELTKNDPQASTSARARARLPWNKVVANETVWALAKEGLLSSPEQAAVVQAARAWVKTWEQDGVAPSPTTDDPTDVALYAAVQALALEGADEQLADVDL